MASQITKLTIVYSSVYSGADQRKHQSSASLAFVRGIHRSPVNSSHKGPVTRKMFPFHDVIMWINARYLPTVMVPWFLSIGLSYWQRYWDEDMDENHIHCFVWHVINHTYPGFNGCSAKTQLKLGHGWVITLVLCECNQTSSERHAAWWRHQMETFSALLVFAGNSPVVGEKNIFLSHRPVTRSGALMFSLICA